jgi:CRP-like cAMP-binding protein
MVPQEELEKVEFLRNLGQQPLGRLALLAQLKECTAGTVLFREGEDSANIYFLLSGQITLAAKGSDGAAAEVHAARPGELLGWSPVLGRHAMTGTARAATATRLAAFRLKDITELGETYPRFGIAFFREVARTLSDRLWATRHRLASVVGNGAPPLAEVEGSD